jgi:hypothetical protein
MGADETAATRKLRFTPLSADCGCGWLVMRGTTSAARHTLFATNKQIKAYASRVVIAFLDRYIVEHNPELASQSQSQQAAKSERSLSGESLKFKF